MRAPTPLPDGLTSEVFTVAEATGLEVSAKRLRGRDLDRSVWGVRALGVDLSLQRRCALIATRAPHAFFSHMTAGALLGIPLPIRLQDERNVHLSVSAPDRAPHARGIRGHSLQIDSTDIVEMKGIFQTSAARTWVDLATHLSLTELVAAGDFLIHWRLPMVSRLELESAARARVGMRGSATTRTALPLLNDRAESPPESELRVVIHLAGLPEPRVNHVLVDAADGRQVRTDLAFPEYRTILEYQGDYHRGRTQWRADMTRRTRLEAQGWCVMELNADDLRDPDELTARIGSALRRRGWAS